MPSDICLGLGKYFPISKLGLAILVFLVLGLQDLATGHLQREERGVDELRAQSKAAVPLVLCPAA